MSHPQCVGLAREVVLWHGFDDQSWVVLAVAPLPAAAIGTIALPRRILGGRMSHPQCVPRRISGGRIVPSAVRWSGEGCGVMARLR